MSGLMVHLLLARRIRPEGSVMFFLGSIAPDAVAAWKEKDITHFRNVLDRNRALADLAIQTPPSDDFAEGILLHLYTDWRWDILARDEFIKIAGDDWFIRYRKEISLTDSYAFHHDKWLQDIWERMLSVNVSEYGPIPGATAVELKKFIEGYYKWNVENETGPSAAFPPEFINNFIDKTAEEYIQWRTKKYDIAEANDDR